MLVLRALKVFIVVAIVAVCAVTTYSCTLEVAQPEITIDCVVIDYQTLEVKKCDDAGTQTYPKDSPSDHTGN